MRYILAISGIIGLVGLLTFTSTGLKAQDKNLWPVTCSDPENPQTCRMTQTHFATKVIDGKTKNIGKVLALTVLYAVNEKTKKRTPYMSIQMPLGVNLPAGAALQVDKNRELKLTFLQCTNSGCDASIQLDSKLLRSILAGIETKVAFTAWGATQSSIVKASLSGFTKSFRKLK